MSVSELFLLAMLVVFTLPWLAWRLGDLDRVAPLVVVQIVAGILLGPGVLGSIDPPAYARLFTPAVLQSLTGIATWAVMLFVWLAGLELDLRLTWRHRAETAVAAGCALLTPLVCGALVAAVLVGRAGWMGEAARPWQFMLGVGMSCAVTALPILVLFMQNLDILRTPLGQRILRYASIDDVAIWGLLSAILMDWQRIGRQVGFVVLFALATPLLRRLMRALAAADRWIVGLVWLLACGFAADWSGFHFMVGAFLSGLVLDRDWFDRERLDLFRDHVLVALMPVFFLSTGLKTSWTMGGASVLAVAGALLAAAVAGKLIGTALAGRLLGWPPGEARLIGWLLQTKALIMIIFANILMDKALIASSTYTALLLMAVASTTLTKPMVRPLLARVGVGAAGSTLEPSPLTQRNAPAARTPA